MLKLGRKPRGNNPHVPKLAQMRQGAPMQLPIPLSVDYSAGLPADLGMLGNDQYGDCTCAAYYHARQVWSAVAQKKLEAETPTNALALYSQACGFNPGDSSTDQGGVEQDVLTYVLNQGAPIGDGTQRDHLIAFAEVDVTSVDDLRRCIYECGVAYIGLNLPQNIVVDSAPPDVWDFVPPADDGGEPEPIVGGHAVVLCGYTLDDFTLISWGRTYRATNRFITNYCEEAYALADAEWVKSTGMTPLGMPIVELEDYMKRLYNA